MKTLQQFFLSEKNIMIAIILNAIVIFFLYFPEFHRHPILEWIDHFFIVVFLLEAIVKISTWGLTVYFSSRWNVFDFLIVLVSLPSISMGLLDIGDVSVLLVLRLFRLVRLIRFFSFVPHLAMIMDGLIRALRASVFVLVALFFLNFMLAIFTCHFYGEVAPEYFGNPLISSYSIFQMFTIEGWNEIPALIATRMNNSFLIGAMRFYFVIVVLFGGILGMSMANAIFVDEMTMDNTRQLEEKIDGLQAQMEELKELLKGG